VIWRLAAELRASAVNSEVVVKHLPRALALQRARTQLVLFDDTIDSLIATTPDNGRRVRS
jgi:hypothetical protein